VVSESQKHKNQRFLAPENSERIFKDSENFDDSQSSKTLKLKNSDNSQKHKVSEA
jgi:hypothetical protein